MLRWLFLILLLLNVVLFGWFYQEQEQRRLMAERAEQQLRGVPELDLLGEVPSSVLRSRHQAQQQAAEQSAGLLQAPTERYCYRFGPFEHADGMALWTANGAPGRLALEAEAETSLKLRYRVAVLAPSTQQAREALQQSMDDVGLQTRWVDAKERGEGVSELLIGSYRDELPAQALAKALREQGQQVRVQQDRTKFEQYFLALYSDDDNLISSDWAALLVQKYPAIKSEKKLCQGVATP